VDVSRAIEPLPLDESFDREYDIEWLRDMPSSSAIQRYGVGGGPILRVTPHDRSPFIVVVPGQTGSLMLSTWPNSRQFAVFNWQDVPVIVDIDRPAEPIRISVFEGHRIRETHRFPKAGIVVMASCCHVVGYDATGQAWERDDLFCCDQRVIDRTDDILIVDGEQHGSPIGGRTLIDVKTGASLC
jgi:hypothetical protein